MIVRSIGPGVLRCALAFLVVFGFAPAVEAAFTVNINGVTVTDNQLLDSRGQAGDTDLSSGFISWTTTIDGYQIRVSSSTDNTRPTADLTTSQLRIVNRTGTAPLFVTITESFNAPPGFIGQQDMLNTLTRNLVAGLSTSGSVTSTTAGASVSGGGSGATDAVTLTNAVDSGMSFGSFDRTSDFYVLTQSITISGLLGSGNPDVDGNGVTITASSFSSSAGNLSVVPAPASVVLLASGIGFLGLYGLGTYRRRLTK